MYAGIGIYVVYSMFYYLLGKQQLEKGIKSISLLVPTINKYIFNKKTIQIQKQML